jgi:hypothetical protein
LDGQILEHQVAVAEEDGLKGLRRSAGGLPHLVPRDGVAVGVGLVDVDLASQGRFPIGPQGIVLQRRISIR